MLVIDTSAIVKFFCKEENWEGVEKYFSDGIATSLALVELGNALLFKVIKQELDFKTASEILSKYAGHGFVLNDEEYMGTALKIAYSKGLTMYDSVFLAACVEEGFGLLTCDRKQAKVARELGIGVTEC